MFTTKRKNRFSKYSRSLLLLLLMWPVSSPVNALVEFDFERPVFIDPGKMIKDHSLILIDGTYHLYYITSNGNQFGHATSPDLCSWTVHRPVLDRGPDDWDSFQVWAPCVVPSPYSKNFIMYYTGANPDLAQRCGIATALDPRNWNKIPVNIVEPFHGDTAWTHWEKTGWSNFRDPCFFQENGTHYLVNTATTKDGLGCLALSRSEDMFIWEDAGPLYIHMSWHALESSVLIKRNGLYHIFFTEENVGGVSHMSSDSLTSGWNLYTRRIIDGMHAPELLDTGEDSYIFSRHSSYTTVAGDIFYSIRFDTLSWSGDVPVVTYTTMIGNRWTILWGTAFNRQPILGDNPLNRGDDTTNVDFEGDWWIGTYEMFNGPLTVRHPGDAQGDEPRGAMRSPDFTVEGRSMRLLVGGGEYPDSCYVALCDAATGSVIYRETGRNTDTMDERIWDLDPLRGRAVYILIVDDCSSPLGHINVDGIREQWIPTNPDPDPGDVNLKADKRIIKLVADPPAGDFPTPEGGRRTAGERMREDAATGADNDGSGIPCAGLRIDNYPNPFNPRTVIRFSGAPDSRMTIIIYSVSGREVKRFDALSDSNGVGAVEWNGRDHSGLPVSAGVYIAALVERGVVTGTRKLLLVR